MKLVFTTKDILEAGVDEIIGASDLKQRLESNKPLRVKFGIDPTSPNIHLGRSVVLWRLRAFQELGHEIHLIVGDFTGQIGDTSDKDAERPMLSSEAVQHNLSHYLEQIWQILNPAKKEQVTIHYNSKWLEPLTLAQLSGMADSFSVNQFIKRELIARRLENGSRVSLREMLYPLMQGYDSVVVQADVELGGTDQRFNMLAGRVLQERAGQPLQAIIMSTLISGTDGRKMSSSQGNVISLLDSAEDMFGKLMAVRDEVLPEYLLVMPLSARPFSDEELQKRFKAGENPRDLKLQLAERVVELYHGAERAAEVKEAFVAQFSQGQKPAEIPEMTLPLLPDQSIVDLLVRTELAPSKSEARRLIEQGGVRLNDQVVIDKNKVVPADPVFLLQVGKRRFLRVVAKN